MKVTRETPGTRLRPVTGMCPSCGKTVTFVELNNTPDFHGGPTSCGVRRCPDDACGQVVFVEVDPQTNKVVEMWPRPTSTFPGLKMPEGVRSALQEAHTCADQRCFVAAAVMLRRTLEMLCADKKATGDDLFARIEALKANAILPAPLFDGMHNLRMLGNDAAHVEAKAYEDIGAAEVETALPLTAEILKAVYGLDEVVAKLARLKKPRP